jgi:tetratricopeptide (TPR) repeat protein
MVIVCLLTVPPGRASAAPAASDKALARQAYQEGTRYYNFGEFDKALESFKAAYLHLQDPALLYNIAQCHRQLGQKAEALQVYRSFLREAVNIPEAQRANVRDVVNQLESSIAADRKAEEDRRAAEAAAAAQAQAQAQAAAAVAVEQPAPPPKKPLYKKWWLWTAVGGVAVAGLAIGLGVGLSRTPSPPSAPTDYQTLKPSF